MANTFLQLYIHLVFAVKNRRSLISEAIRDEVQRYITSIIQKRGHKLLAIYCMPDHIHILTGYNPNHRIPDLVKMIKVDSNELINARGLTKDKFEWQTGYGAFSYSRWDLQKIINYIRQQPEHHKRTSFK